MNNRPVSPAQLDAIVTASAAATGITVEAIVGPDKLLRARFAVAWVAREALEASYARIGRALGGRDHTTIIYAIKRAAELRESDPDFRTMTDRMVDAARAHRRVLPIDLEPADG